MFSNAVNSCSCLCLSHDQILCAQGVEEPTLAMAFDSNRAGHIGLELLSISSYPKECGPFTTLPCLSKWQRGMALFDEPYQVLPRQGIGILDESVTKYT